MEGYIWKSTNSDQCVTLQGTAVRAGHEGHDQSPIYVGRAHYRGDVIPCKVITKHRVAYIPFDGQEIRVFDFEMLCRSPNARRPVKNVRWVKSSNGDVPPGAIPAGRTSSGETLYVGRVREGASLTPGKVHPSHKCCYISFGGKELSHRSYEIMTI